MHNYLYIYQIHSIHCFVCLIFTSQIEIYFCQVLFYPAPLSIDGVYSIAYEKKLHILYKFMPSYKNATHWKLHMHILPGIAIHLVQSSWYPINMHKIWRYPSVEVSIKLYALNMMTSSNGNMFRVTGHLCGEFTGPRWIPRTKASDAELWCLLWSAPE